MPAVRRRRLDRRHRALPRRATNPGGYRCVSGGASRAQLPSALQQQEAVSRSKLLRSLSPKWPFHQDHEIGGDRPEPGRCVACCCRAGMRRPGPPGDETSASPTRGRTSHRPHEDQMTPRTEVTERIFDDLFASFKDITVVLEYTFEAISVAARPRPDQFLEAGSLKRQPGALTSGKRVPKPSVRMPGGTERLLGHIVVLTSPRIELGSVVCRSIRQESNHLTAGVRCSAGRQQMASCRAHLLHARWLDPPQPSSSAIPVAPR